MDGNGVSVPSRASPILGPNTDAKSCYRIEVNTVLRKYGVLNNPTRWVHAMPAMVAFAVIAAVATVVVNRHRRQNARPTGETGAKWTATEEKAA